MKKILIFALAACLLLASCTKKKPPETTEDTSVNIPVVTIPMVTTEAASSSYFEDVKVETPDVGPGIDVEYDVLTLDDETLNEILKSMADAELARYIPNISSVIDNGGSADYDVKTKSIYKTDTLLSAVFGGSYAVYYEGGEESGEVLYTININPASGKVIGFNDIVTSYDTLKNAFDSGKFTPIGEEPYANDLSQYNPSYEIYPYISLDGENFYLYIAESGADEFVTGYSISLETASDFINEKYRTAEE